jgi:hypothetical protein
MTPGSLPDPTSIAAVITRHLERLGVSYVIGGSFASSLHGEPRSTNDVDMVVELDEASAERFVESLGADFYADRDAAVAAVRSGASFNVVHIVTAVKIDLFVAGADPLDNERLRRRRHRFAGAGTSNLAVQITFRAGMLIGYTRYRPSCDISRLS